MKKSFLNILLIFGLFCTAKLYSQAPNWVWARGAHASTENVNDVAVDKSTGDVYIVGSFNGNLSPAYNATMATTTPPNYGGIDAFLIKYTSAGILLWTHRMGGSGTDIAYGVSVDNSGNVYVTGKFQNTANFFHNPNQLAPNTYDVTANGGDDIFIAKYNSSGVVQWAVHGGGTSNDEARRVKADANGVYITGSYNSSGGNCVFSSTTAANVSIPVVAGSVTDMFVAKYSVNGIVQWAAKGVSPSADIGYGITADANNVYVIGDYYNSFTPYNASNVAQTVLANQGTTGDVFITCYSQAGAYVWGTNISSSTTDMGRGITDDANDLYITGGISNNANFKHPGPAFTMTSAGSQDLYLAKLSKSNGVFQFVKVAPGNSTDYGQSIAYHSSGRLYISGRFAAGTQTISFATLGPGGPVYTSAGLSDVIVASFSVSGNFIYAQKAGGARNDIGYGIDVDNMGDAYVGGDGASAALAFGTTTTCVLANNSNIFIAKLGCGVILPAAQAGPGQTVCATATVLAGNNAAPGVGTWSLQSGSGVPTSPNSPNSAVTGLGVGNNTFVWNISGSGCTELSDTVIITRHNFPTTSNAGSNQTVCATATTMAGNTPAVGTGTWSLVSGAGNITSPTTPNTGITALGVGVNVFMWSIGNGVCANSTSTMSIQRDQVPTVSNAGPNQTVCATATVFAGNTPAVGTGTWSLVSGAGVPTSPTSPNSAVTGLGVGVNVFQWTIGNGVCATSSSTMSITRHDFPSTSVAGANQTVCATVATMAGNTPAVGTATWSLISGAATITSPNVANSGVTAIGLNINVFEWTISNGVCPNSTSTMSIQRDNVPTVSNAGPSQSICAITSANMAANIPAVGTGSWTLLSGSALITTATSPNTGITALGLGVNVFEWTITNGVCPTSSSTMSITRYANPTVSSAGPNQTVCATTANMAANTPAIGTGSWTLISGAGTITNPTLETTGITALGLGINVFEWTITNGVCPSSSSTMSIQRDDNPTASVAGPNQTVCATTANMAGNPPAVGTGSWTLVSGSAVITSPTLPNTGITALGVGVNVFMWTISNGVCPNSTSTMSIQRDAVPTAAVAGPNQTVCVGTGTMAANTPAIGTGTWTLISGSAVITTPNSPSSGLTSIALGSNIFEWAIGNGVCPVSTSTVEIYRDNNPSLSNAGPNQTVCATTAVLAGNTPAVGTGSWTLVSGIATIVSPTSPTSLLTGLGVGINVLQWTVINGACPPSSTTVSIQRDNNPTLANAGPSQTLCATTATTMAGNVPAVGTGSWTLISGAATIVTPTLATTNITGIATGTNIFQWTISNGVCPSSSATMAIIHFGMPTSANAGPNQTICATSTVLAGNTAAVGTGSWTLVSGSAVITSPTSANSGITSVAVGINVLQWTISNGICPSSSSTISVQRDAGPTTSNAGPNQVVCSTTANMAGNAAAIGTGTWTLISGAGTITNPNLATTGITALGVGVNVFQWTIGNGVCATSSSTMSIQRDANPTTSNAGPNQTVCATSVTLAANTAVTGIGVWNVLTGPGTVVTPIAPNSQVIGLGVGSNVFEWQITNGVCPASTSTIEIWRDQNPTVSNAGPSVSICATSTTMAGNVAAIGTGSWTLVSGSGIIVSPTLPNTNIVGLGLGINVFMWTITSGVCPASTSTMSITRYGNPTPSAAGPNQTICATMATMAGNTPAIGTGSWTLISGAATITTPTLETTGITALGIGINIFQWTISNGVCVSSSSTMSIQRDPNPTTSAAGPNQTICANSSAMTGNVPAIGTGTWTLISGSGTITNPNLATTGITALGIGVNVFQWTIGNGLCPNSSSTVSIQQDQVPTVSAAGSNQTVCATFATMTGNTPAVGTGSWTLISGIGTITTPTSPTSGLTALGVGVNVFQWTISNGVCASSSSTISVQRDANPSVATAGPNQTVCASVATLAGNTPAIGTGSWTLVSGSAVITSPTLPNSGVTGLGFGVNVFQWTISNGVCASTTATMSVQRDQNPTVSSAGTNQTLCATPATNMTGNTPGVGTGSWTLISGAGNITSPNLSNTGITALGTGTNIFQWTISNGVCPSSSSTMAVINFGTPTSANAGVNQTVCANVATLAGNIPAVGTGSWTLVSGIAVITSPTLPNSGVTGLGAGVNIFQWTISNGICPPSTSTVSIQRDLNPTPSSAGANQVVCSTTATMNGNLPAIGTGSWTLVSGAGAITTPTLNTTGITALGVGINVFRWTISNGVCANSQSTMSIQRDANPTPANAGPSQTICSSTATLAGNTPAIGFGVWNVVTGPGLVATPIAPNSQVISLGFGINEFEWSITNGVCPVSTSTVLIYRDTPPSTAIAGPSQSVCALTATMNATAPAVGTGSWTLISGSGTIATTTLNTTPLSALGIGVNIFQWTISNGVCSSSSATVSIQRDANPSAAVAGPSQSVCANFATLAGNTPAIGTGSWTLISGGGTIASPTLATSGLTALGTGSNVFMWTISNGVCVPSTSTVLIQADAVPTAANAGPNQTLCTTSTTLAGNVPAIGTGSWTLISGGATITSPSLPNSGITSVAVGTNILQWSISNGVCPPSISTVAIIRDASPSISNAGPSQTICSGVTTLAGNTPAVGTGSWTLISGAATITTPTLETSGVTAVAIGTTILQWTISNGVCASTTSTMSIVRDPNPTVSNAGPNQTICATATVLAGNTPAIGTGSWTLISGSATITTPTLQTSGITGIGVGTNVLQWTISNGVCPPSISTVAIIRDDFPSLADAGVNQTICATSTVLAGNVPVVGTGLWTLISGVATITTPTLNNSGVTAIAVGVNTFQWTISNGVCPVTTSTVSIQRDANPTVSNAGPNQTICATSTVFAGNAPAIGTGSWTLISGSAIIPSPTLATSAVNTIAGGVNVFQWTISNGVCPSSSSTVSIQRDLDPTISNAGPNQTVCATTATLAGNTPTIGTGLWTLLSGGATITGPTIPTTGLTALAPGVNVLQWTISNGICPSTTSTVSVQRDDFPSLASAGPNQSVCATNAVMAGNTPAVGTGSWTLISGGGNITAPTLPASGLTSLTIGVNVFQWTISNGVCPVTTSTVSIQRDADPTISNAGSSMSICATSTFMAANAPAVGTGTWSVISGNGIFGSSNAENSAVTSIGLGVNVYQWAIGNGVCPNSTSTVAITSYTNPTGSVAGPNQTICATATVLAANTPVVGSGIWAVLSGPAVVTSPNAPNSGVTGLGVGANVFQWMITNGVCNASTSTVSIQRDANPTPANAGPNQTLCVSYTDLEATPTSIGTGTWTLVSGTGTITSPTSATSTFTDLTISTHILQWSTSNGVCPISTSTVSITGIANVAPVNAGPDIFFCGYTPTLAGLTPTVGTGTWVPQGGPNVTSPNNPTSPVTFTSAGTYTYVWFVGYASCPNVTDTVEVTLYDMPTISSVGADQTLCISNANSTISANSPVIGNGFWNVVNGPGNVTTPSVNISAVTGLSVGINSFEWAITSGVCPPSTSTINIQVDATPSTPVAGADQTICVSSANLNATNPAIGTGQWNVLTGGGTVVTPTLNSTTVSALVVGLNTFEWQVTNGVCPSVTDTMNVFVDAIPSTALAGADQFTCGLSTFLAGNVPAIGSGTWMPVGSAPAVSSPTSVNSSVSFTDQGVYNYMWVIGNGTCPTSTDVVTINNFLNPSDPDAGPDQSICAMNTTLSANTISIGTGSWIAVDPLSIVNNSLVSNSPVSLPNQGVFPFVWQTSNSSYCPVKNDTVNIRTYSNPSAANAGLDMRSDCLLNTLVAVTPSVGTGVWSVLTGTGEFDNIGSPSTNYTSDVDGTTTLVWIVSNGNCPTSADTMELVIDPLLIPQIVTPNGDGNNDVFEIKAFSCLSGVKINIFNRWGNLVYDSSDYKNDFGGKNNQGENLVDDTYFYVIELPKKTYKGYAVVRTGK